ncbi:MAG: four-carbon acid sugar kinase family protein [Deltaproteobacteria bacterium]|nr:four-carbon acid sugar kinase family protein [Deltaproteobacteria bacterium]
MTGFTAIADDLTGACDVAAELAVAGWRVRVAVDANGLPGREDGGIVVVNTQSRALAPQAAYARVREALGARRAPVVLKKIDTALRGHLGAELDGALDALDAPAFVLAAIPAAGRVTRNGCQWFGDRLLAATEFAGDPEGPGAVSSIPEVLGRESRRRVAVIARDVVRTGRFAAEVARHRGGGVDVFVVDAESDDDVAAAVTAILSLARPICLAGSIALAAALAPHLDGTGTAPPASRPPCRVPLPALIVSGSLHSRARAQIAAVLAAGSAVASRLPPADAGAAALSSAATTAQARLASGTSVVLAPGAPTSVPTTAALRAMEDSLAAAVETIARGAAIPTLVLIGGETSHAVLTRLGAGEIEVDGRVAPLIARGTIGHGTAAGSTVVTKGGSGGEPDVIARLVAGEEARS